MRDEATTNAGEAMGRLEYVIEKRRRDSSERFYVMRADSACVRRYAELGVSVGPGSRVVIEADSLRPIGVLEEALPPAASSAGYNPYFDLPAA